MKKLVALLSFFIILNTNSSLKAEESYIQSYLDAAEEPGAILFNPPTDWKVADPKALPPHVKAMVIGKGKGDFPPSINIGMEPWEGTVKDYLQKVVKPSNDNAYCEWKDLGNIKTQAGEASLSQVDVQSSYGTQRLMHVILKKGDSLYVLTVAALKDEFPEFYKEFFAAMRSLRFNKDVFEMIPSAKRKGELKTAIKKLKDAWQKIQQESDLASKDNVEALALSNDTFQEEYWKPFQDMLIRSFADMGPLWHKHIRNHVESELSEMKKKI